MNFDGDGDVEVVATGDASHVVVTVPPILAIQPELPSRSSDAACSVKGGDQLHVAVAVKVDDHDRVP